MSKSEDILQAELTDKQPKRGMHYIISLMVSKLSCEDISQLCLKQKIVQKFQILRYVINSNRRTLSEIASTEIEYVIRLNYNSLDTNRD